MIISTLDNTGRDVPGLPFIPPKTVACFHCGHDIASGLGVQYMTKVGGGAIIPAVYHPHCAAGVQP